MTYVSQEKATDSSTKSSSHLTTRPNGPSYAPVIPIDIDDGVSYKGWFGFGQIRNIEKYETYKYYSYSCVMRFQTDGAS